MIYLGFQGKHLQTSTALQRIVLFYCYQSDRWTHMSTVKLSFLFFLSQIAVQRIMLKCSLNIFFIKKKPPQDSHQPSHTEAQLSTLLKINLVNYNLGFS